MKLNTNWRIGKIRCPYCESLKLDQEFTQKKELKFYLDPYVDRSRWRGGDFTMSPQLQQAWETEILKGAAYWTDEFDLKAEVVQTKEESNWSVTIGQIDGRGRTLAWNTIPPYPTKMRLDSRERWVSHRVGRFSLAVIAHEVIAHEIGHGLGIGHGGDGLMAASYKGEFQSLTDDDIKLGLDAGLVLK